LTVTDKNGSVTKVSATDVYFKELTKTDIEKYLDSDEYKDKAGAYGIQGYAARFVEKIHGCYFNVVGLPLSLLDKILTEKEIR
jgi:septum formation protein